MKTYTLPDSPEKRNLIQYLNEMIKKCEDEAWRNGGAQEISRQEEVWEEKASVYREILRMIQ